MTTGPDNELRDLRGRMETLQLHLDKQGEIVAFNRPLLEQESTYPHPRKALEEELERAIRFDIPMLLEEQVKAKRRIAELEEEVRATARAAAQANEEASPPPAA